jgi:hypothetical protein
MSTNTGPPPKVLPNQAAFDSVTIPSCPYNIKTHHREARQPRPPKTNILGRNLFSANSAAANSANSTPAG